MNPGREKVVREAACRVCASTHQLEAAHTWDRSLGGFMHADLLVPLCRSCHRLYDAHLLDILPFLDLHEQMMLVRAAGGIERARKRAIGTPTQP